MLGRHEFWGDTLQLSTKRLLFIKVWTGVGKPPRDSAVSRAIKAEGYNCFLKARGNGNLKSLKESLKEEATLTRATTFD